MSFTAAATIAGLNPLNPGNGTETTLNSAAASLLMPVSTH